MSTRKNTIRLKKFIPLLLAASGLGIFISLTPLAHAQISAKQQPSTADAKICQDVNSTAPTCTRKNTDGTTTVCGGPNQLGSSIKYCTVQYPDGSYTKLDLNGANGSYQNFDASGQLTGATDRSLSNGSFGLGDSATGTAKNPPLNSSGGDGIIMRTLADVAFGILWLAGSLLGMVGALFNWIVVITVFQFGAYFGNSHGMLIAWGILRDIGNIILLFGFILISVMVILDIHGFDAKRALPRFIIFAVLLNFSLFASEAIVDVANGLTATLYKQAGQASLTSDKCTAANGVSNQDCVNVGIAGTIINDTYLGTALNPTEIAAGQSTGTSRFLAYVGIALFVTIVMVLLLAAAIMFFTRAVMLVILLVVSPIAFAAMAIPQFEGQAREWWNKLIANAFFAPIFLLLMFVGLKVMEGARTALGGSSANLANALSRPDVSMGGILIVFGLTIGFMIAALQFAKGSGVAGAQFATSFAQKTVQRTMTAPFRVAATGGKMVGAGVYRGTVGKGAEAFSKAYDAKMGAWRQAGGKTEAFAKAARFFKLDDVIHDTATKAQTAKPLGRNSYLEEKKRVEGRTDELTHAAEKAENLNGLKSALGMPSGTAEEKLARDGKIQELLQKIPQADLEQTKYLRENAEGIADIARNLTPERFDAMMSNKDISDARKENLAHHRFASIQEALKGGYANKEAIRSLTTEDLTALAKYNTQAFAELSNITNPDTGDMMMSREQFDAIKKSKSLTAIQRENLKNHERSVVLAKTVAMDPAPLSAADRAARSELIAKYSKNMTKDEVGNITNKDVLLNEDFVRGLNRDKLAAIASKGVLQDPQDRIKLLRNIQSHYSFVPPTDPSFAGYEDMKKYLGGNKNARSWWGDTLV
jgi:hypothetical protein